MHLAHAPSRVLALASCLSVLVSGGVVRGQSRERRGASDVRAALAFASLGPLNTDLFVSDASGGEPKPFLPNPALDYNASFSADGRWVVFTSERAGSADIYRAHADGSGLERLTTIRRSTTRLQCPPTDARSLSCRVGVAKRISGCST